MSDTAMDRIRKKRLTDPETAHNVYEMVKSGSRSHHLTLVVLSSRTSLMTSLDLLMTKITRDTVTINCLHDNQHNNDPVVKKTVQQANPGLLTMDSRKDKAAHHGEQRVPILPTYNKIIASSHASQQTE